MLNKDEYYMNIAYKEALKAYKEGEIPVGAIIVDKNGKIISRGFNIKENKKDVTGHAEIVAIKKAEKKLNNWRLDDCKIYVTLEPCLMCSSAIFQSKIKEIFVGCKRSDKNELTLSDLNDFTFDNGYSIKYGILEQKCSEILSKFFKNS